MKVAKWGLLAAFLLSDEDGSVTAKIQNNNRDDDDCCADMIREYLKSGDVSWQHVFESLQYANYSNLAFDMVKDLDIKGMLKIQSILFCVVYMEYCCSRNTFDFQN